MFRKLFREFKEWIMEEWRLLASVVVVAVAAVSTARALIGYLTKQYSFTSWSISFIVMGSIYAVILIFFVQRSQTFRSYTKVLEDLLRKRFAAKRAKDLQLTVSDFYLRKVSLSVGVNIVLLSVFWFLLRPDEVYSMILLCWVLLIVTDWAFLTIRIKTGLFGFNRYEASRLIEFAARRANQGKLPPGTPMMRIAGELVGATHEVPGDAVSAGAAEGART